MNVDNPDPSVAVTAPAAGASVRGSTVPVTASASNLPADGFSLGFLLNGYILGFDDAAPWATTLDTSWFADGAVALRAEVQGWDGRTTTSAPRTVNIANTTGWVSTPAQNATVKGSIQFWVSAFTDRTNQIEVVRFYVDGKAVASDGIAGYGYTWNTKTVANGSHVLTARITTMDGRGFTTAPRTVTVSN